tara:strand:- start:2059 stop:2433 length:375 start_codon:yes stop_codon:yes gene_type:complete
MFIVHTQTLENYGAHAESGKFADGQNYWKFKFGDTYLVEDLDRASDAMAFVAALAMENSVGWKEFPIEVQTVQEWAETLPDDAGDVQSSRDYYLSQVIRVSPKRQKSKKFTPIKGMTERELEVF